MTMKKKMNFLLFMIMALFLGMSNVDAHGVESLSLGDRVCLDTSVFTEHYIYTWNSVSGEYNEAWPGIKMTKDENSNISCYEVTVENHDKLIFNNGNGLQTVDLTSLGDGLIYSFASSDTDYSGMYAGKWYVYDTSDLVNLVEKVQTYNESDYTIDSYQNLLKVLNGDENTIGAIELSKKDYTDSNMLIQIDDQGNFYSVYENVYNELLDAEKALTKRGKIVVNDTLEGKITASYKNGSDSTVVITSTPDIGYRLKALKVTEITGYDSESKPILGNIVKDFVVDDSVNTYEYDTSSSDIFIEADYERKTYILKFIVGENGVINDENGQEVSSPVTVYYNDDYTLKIETAEGYVLNKVTVNKKEVVVENNQLTIKNIVSDTEIEITFTIIEYVVKVDGLEYKVPYGTTYEELLKLVNTMKDGYIFKGIVDKDNNPLNQSHLVDGNEELSLVFEKINEEVKIENEDEKVQNPNTVNGFINIGLICIVVASFLIPISRLRKNRYVK